MTSDKKATFRNEEGVVDPARGEVSAALDEIEQAASRMRTVQLYLGAAPFLVLWGFIWLTANVVLDTFRNLAIASWVVLGAIGVAGTIIISVRNASVWSARRGLTDGAGKALGKKFAMLGVATLIFLPASLLIVAPMSSYQTNAFITLFWTFAYMVAGAFVGWRLFLVGLVSTLSVVIGFLFLRTHYHLWVGFMCGGALIAGGLWLRKM